MLVLTSGSNTIHKKGFAEAIASIFPQTQVQSCLIHQIGNSLKYVSSKDQKEFLQDLKPVYAAVNKASAEEALLELSTKWEKKYPLVINSWQHNWEKLSTYFQYTEPVRRIIYTTNTIEGFHRQVRKVTKTKGALSRPEKTLQFLTIILILLYTVLVLILKLLYKS